MTFAEYKRLVLEFSPKLHGTLNIHIDTRPLFNKIDWLNQVKDLLFLHGCDVMKQHHELTTVTQDKLTYLRSYGEVHFDGE